MQTLEGFDFFPLTFDEEGKPSAPVEFEALKQRAASATDVIILAHGFRNSVAYATNLYTNFLKTFRSHFARPECKLLNTPDFVVAGVYWPSMILPEMFEGMEGSTQSLDPEPVMLASLKNKLTSLKDMAPAAAPQIDRAIQLLPSLKSSGEAQNSFTDLLLSAVHDPVPDPTEGLDKIRNQDGVTILQKLAPPFVVRTAAADSDSGTTEGLLASVESTLASVDRFVNLSSWWIMKNRCGVVGETGVAQSVRALFAMKPALKVHLVGHSLGGRLMAACAKSLAQDPICRPTSLTLLEAAFSHYGFSKDNGFGVAGFFRDVIGKQVVKGPLIATFSAQDTVVGNTYSLASRVARDSTEAIGDATDPYGGIGHNGALKTVESTVAKLQKAGAGDYALPLGVVNCLDGSGGLIKDHGDVTNPDVTYAFAQVVIATQAGTAATGG